MKYLLLLIFQLINISICFADEPPSWEPYITVSENKEFYAIVYYADNDSLKQPWERKWNLNVFKKDSTLFWKRPYQPFGYKEGNLTNDGENFVIVTFWYYSKANVVNIYNKDLKDHFITGNQFKINQKYLPETSSHRLWRDDFEILNNKILIETNDKNKWEVDIKTGKLTLVEDYNSLLISRIAIGSLFLFIIILGFYLLRKHFKTSNSEF